jgi:hypothetical protein
VECFGVRVEVSEPRQSEHACCRHSGLSVVTCKGSGFFFGRRHGFLGIKKLRPRQEEQVE